MANTKELKTVVELFMVNKILEKFEAKSLPIKKIIGMQPDIIACDHKTLYIGEVTSSGFMGSKRGNYHAGGIKKLFEAFCKFSILKSKEAEVLSFCSEKSNCCFTEINYLFITPKNSKFLSGLGYRDELFEMGNMTLEEVELDDNTRKTLEDILNKCKNENTSK